MPLEFGRVAIAEFVDADQVEPLLTAESPAERVGVGRLGEFVDEGRGGGEADAASLPTGLHA